MALVISDRVKETSITTGTGTITLSGAYGGFQSFSTGIGNGNKTYYAIENETRWEVGIGTYTLSSNTLTRDTVLASSSSGNLISLFGVSTVFCTYPSDKAVFLNEDGLLDLNTFSSGVIYPGTSQFDTIIIDDSAAGDHYCPPHDTTDKLYNVSGELWWDGYAIGPTVSGWANNSLVALDALMNLKDENISGWANQSITNTGIAISGWSNSTMSNLDAAISGWSHSTLNESDTSISGWAKGYIDSKQAVSALSVSGWADYKDTAISGWAGETVSTVSGWTGTTVSTVSGWAGETITNSRGSVSGWASSTISELDGSVSGWASSTMNSLDSSVSGWASYAIKNHDDINISGDFNYQPYADKMITLKRSASGNFLHAYVDDTSDRTITLYSNGGSSPKWQFGLKSSPNSSVEPPSYGYIYGQDGDAGIIADSTNQVVIANSNGFFVKHQNSDVFRSSSVTGVHINSVASAYPALTVNGGVSLAADIQRWTTSAGSILSVVNKSGKFGIGKTTAAYEVDVDGSGKFDQIYFTSGIIFSDGTTQTTNATAALSGWALQTIGNSGVSVSGWTSSTFSTVADNASLSGYAEAILSAEGGYISWGLGDGTSNIDNISNAQSVAISGLSGITTSYDINGNLLKISAASLSGWSNGTFSTNVNVNSVSGWIDNTTTTRDNAVSGWATQTFITSDANTTYTAGSGLELVGTVFNFVDSGKILKNSASGVAISGWADATFIKTDNNTTYTAGSGLELVGTTFHFLDSGKILANSASGVAISGWTNATFDTKSNTTAISGWVLKTIGNSGVAVSGWANGTFSTNANVSSVSGWTNSTFDTKANTAAISGYAEGIAGGGSSYTWSISDGIVTADSISNAQTVFISGISGITTEYIAGDNLLKLSTASLSGWANETFSSGISPHGASGSIQVANGVGGIVDAAWKINTTKNILHTPTTKGGSFVVAKDGVNHTVGVSCVAINNGAYARSYGQQSIGIGNDAIASALRSVTIGNTINNGTASRVMIGAYQTALLDFAKEDGVFRISDLELQNGDDASNAAQFTVMKTWTSSTNHEGLRLGTDGVYHTISSVAGTGGGTVRDISINSDLNVSGVATFQQNMGLRTTAPAYGIQVVGAGASGLIQSSGILIGPSGIGVGTTTPAHPIDVVQHSGVVRASGMHSAISMNADAATVIFDLDQATTHGVTLGNNRTLALSNVQIGDKFLIRLQQDGTGSRTVTWFNHISWAGGSAPTLTTTANKADLLGFLTASGTGSDYWFDGLVVGQNI